MLRESHGAVPFVFLGVFAGEDFGGIETGSKLSCSSCFFVFIALLVVLVSLLIMLLVVMMGEEDCILLFFDGDDENGCMRRHRKSFIISAMQTETDGR